VALTETAADRYESLLTAAVPALNPELRAAALKAVIDGAAAAPAPALVAHIAANSPLTTAKAEPLVAAALADEPGNSTQKAAAVSQAVANTLPSVNVELSEAVMLEGKARLWFAIGFSALLAVCVAGVIVVGTESSPPEAVMITLSVIAILLVAGVLMLVMGYKTAKVKIGS
jgi:hypothetical protein